MREERSTMKNTIYIDYTSCVPYDTTKVHGGGNYTKEIITQIIKYNPLEQDIVVIWPEGYNPMDEYEQFIYTSDICTRLEVKVLSADISFVEHAVLFLPLHTKVVDLSDIQMIKAIHPTIKVYYTLHGLRALDMRYDKCDRYYFTGLKFWLYPFAEPIKNLLVIWRYKQKMKATLSVCDKIFTVSNFSLSQIAKCISPKFLCYYYQNCIVSHKERSSQKTEQDFCLFVSGNRLEKNLMRTMTAFLKYKMIYQDNLYLYVTGTNEKLCQLLYRNPKIDRALAERWIKFLGYVELDELDELYQTCKFMLYPSKSEGFGLPVLEAFMKNTMSLCAIGTAIPEVLGSGAYYVDPYSEQSICDGIARMYREGGIQLLKKNYTEKKQELQMHIEFDQQRLIKEICDY